MVVMVKELFRLSRVSLRNHRTMEKAVEYTRKTETHGEARILDRISFLF
jgi:hypothetical protein